MVETALTDEELKKIHGLEYLTTIEEDGKPLRKIGFTKGKLVSIELNRDGSIGRDVTFPIGDNFYDSLKKQAISGKYNSAKEYVSRLLAPLSDYEKMPF